MGMRGTYHRTRVLQLVDRFRVWRQERPSGVRAFQSIYDRYVGWLSSWDDRIELPSSRCRVGTTVCKWLYQSLHDLHAISTFDYILPLMVRIYRLSLYISNWFWLSSVRNLQVYGMYVHFPAFCCAQSRSWHAIVNDNDDLASRASRLLVRMLGVTPPVPLVSPILDAIFHTIQSSPVSIPVSYLIRSLILI